MNAFKHVSTVLLVCDGIKETRVYYTCRLCRAHFHVGVALMPSHTCNAVWKTRAERNAELEDRLGRAGIQQPQMPE